MCDLCYILHEKKVPLLADLLNFLRFEHDISQSEMKKFSFCLQCFVSRSGFLNRNFNPIPMDSATHAIFGFNLQLKDARKYKLISFCQRLRQRN